MWLYDECHADVVYNSLCDFQSLDAFVNLSVTNLLVIGLAFVSEWAPWPRIRFILVLGIYVRVPC